jgi:hypothetical protein
MRHLLGKTMPNFPQALVVSEPRAAAWSRLQGGQLLPRILPEGRSPSQQLS